MSVNHYENFPVASILLPARLRPAVQTIYRFARSADDLADEGDAPPAQRLAALAHYEASLDKIENGQSCDDELFTALADVIRIHALPLQPLRDLLSAFRQDVTVTRYADFDSLLDYCRRSANPVGLLMLHLYGQATPENIRQSDAICTALQLINFWQDIAIDIEKHRIYLPQEDLQNFGVSAQQIEAQVADDAWRSMLRFQTAHSRALMQDGADLARRLPGRLGYELRLVVQGGLRILERIDAVEGDVFRHRPTLGKGDWLRLLWRAWRM